MKSTSLQIIFYILLITSCQHSVENSTVDQTQSQNLNLENENLDLKFNQDLKSIWSRYFTSDFNETKSLDIFFVTNRQIKGSQVDCTNETVGVTLDQVSRYGLCRVNVPKNHTTGQINFTSDARQNSHDNFKILNAKVFDQQTLFKFLAASKRTPLVFVHGFNVKFQEAVLRASQIAYDVKYQGPIVLLSWPAGAGDGFFDDKLVNNTYKNNSKAAAESISTFSQFFNELQKNQIKINLYVHSMGHQIVLPALVDILKQQDLPETNVVPASHLSDQKLLINELILNAPDFEERKFKEIAPQLVQIAKRITLYCSYNDNAIVASETLNKNKRIGSCSFVDQVDVINVSELDAPTLGLGLGHGYYSSRLILSDVFQVLLGMDAEKRLFIRKSEPNTTEKYILKP